VKLKIGDVERAMAKAIADFLQRLDIDHKKRMPYFLTQNRRGIEEFLSQYKYRLLCCNSRNPLTLTARDIKILTTLNMTERRRKRLEFMAFLYYVRSELADFILFRKKAMASIVKFVFRRMTDCCSVSRYNLRLSTPKKRRGEGGVGVHVVFGLKNGNPRCVLIPYRDEQVQFLTFAE